jgi:hypothetical protein
MTSVMTSVLGCRRRACAAFGCDVEVGFGDGGPGFFFDFGDHFGWLVADAEAAAVVGGET